MLNIHSTDILSLSHTQRDSDKHRLTLTLTHTHRPHRLSGAMAPTVSSPVLVKSCCTFLPKTRSASGYNLPGDGLAMLAGYGWVCVCVMERGYTLPSLTTPSHPPLPQLVRVRGQCDTSAPELSLPQGLGSMRAGQSCRRSIKISLLASLMFKKTRPTFSAGQNS